MTTPFDPLDAAIDSLPPAEAMEEPRLLRSHATSVEMASSHAPDALDAAIDQLPASREVDGAQAKRDEERRGELLRWAVRASERSPEEQAEVFRLSVALDAPPDLIADDLPWARKEVDARKLDVAKVLQSHPALEEFLGDPETAALARGDTERLAGLARLIGGELDGHRVPGVVERLLEGRARARELVDLKQNLMTGQVRDVDTRAPWEPAPEVGPASQSVGIPGVAPARTQGAPAREMSAAEKEALRATIREKEQAYARFRAHGDGVEDLGLVGRTAAKTARILVDMGPEMLEAAAITAVAGPLGAAAATAFWAHESAPDMFWQLSEMRDAAGQPMLSEGAARGMALVSSVPLGYLNAISLEGLGATFKGYAASKPFVTRAVARIIPDAAERLTSVPGFGGRLVGFLGDYGSHATQAGVMMGLQSGVQAATLEAAKSGQGYGFDTAAVTQAFVEGSIQGLKDFAVIAAFRPAMNLLAERGKVAASIESARVLRDVAEGTRESKLAQRSPEKFAELVKKLGPDAKVHVDLRGISELAQKENTTPRKLAAALMGDDGAAFDRLAETGRQDLSVPLAAWAEKAVKSGLHEKLARDVRTSLDEFTPRQLEEHAKEVQKQVEERAAERGTAFQEETKKLEGQIATVAKAAGYGTREAQAVAKKLSAFAATQSLRMDVSLREGLIRAGFPQLRLEGRELLGGLMKELSVTAEERAATGTTEHAPAGSEHVARVAQAEAAWDAVRRFKEERGVTGEALEDGSAPVLKDEGAPADWSPEDDKKLGDLVAAAEAADAKTRTPANEVQVTTLEGGGVVTAKLTPAAGKADPDYGRALAHVAGLTEVSVSRLQRELKIGFNRAASFIAQMEKDGLIGPSDGVRPRQVFPFDPSKVQSTLAQGNRGTIRMRLDGRGAPVEFDISALSGDKSTLAHESAHFLGWSLHKLATADGAEEGIARDYRALLGFGGWDSAEARVAENLERTQLADRQTKGEKLTAAEEKRLTALEAKEERVASAWEVYLSEGKAPTADLAPLFGRYAKWMAQVYRGIPGPAEQFKLAYGEDLAVSPEVRGVFDRLLAVDNEVERARTEDARAKLEDAPLSAEDRARITRLREAKYAEMQERLIRAVVRDGARRSTGTLRDIRDRVRAEVKADVDTQQVYIAHDFLATGELRTEDGKVFASSDLPEAFRRDVAVEGRIISSHPLRLSYKDAVKLVGEKNAKLLRQRGLTMKSGAKADRLAGLLGYDSGKAMLEALIGAEPRDNLIERETAARFEDVFGPELAYHEALLQATGNDALHNPADIAETVTIRNAVAREIGGRGRLPTDVLHRQAEAVVSKMRLEELSPRIHLEAERRGSRKAFDLMAKAKRAVDAGKLDESDRLYSEALHELDGVLLSKALYRAADGALKRRERIEDVLTRATKDEWKSVLGKADPAYSDAHEAVLGAIGRGDERLARPDVIDGALAALQRDGDTASGVGPDEDGRLTSAFWDAERVRGIIADKTPWEKLTVADAEAVHDALVQMRVTASDLGKVAIAGKRVERAGMLQALRESASRLRTSGEAFSWHALKAHEKVGFAARLAFHGIDSVLTDIETLVDRLVGDDRNHPAWEFLVGERARARAAEIDMGERFVKAMHEKWSDLPKEMRARALQAADGALEALGGLPEAGGIFNRKRSRLTYENLWMIALNFGNAGNKQRLLDGFGWSESAVRDVLAKHLTEADWRWVEGVWASLSDLYPALAETHRKATGLRLQRVEAEKFTIETADGKEIEVSGGYFPAKLDKRAVSKRNLADRQDAAFEALTAINRRPRTNSSASHKRAEKNTDMLDLDFGVVPTHVAQVVHDATHRLYVKDLATVVMDGEFQKIVRGSMGITYEKQFQAWARDVAGAGKIGASLGLEPIHHFLSFAKSKATLAAVGFNVGVPLADMTNPFLPVIAGDLSAGSLARALQQAPTRWKDMRAFALENSAVMRERARTGNSLGIEVGHATGRSGWSGKVEHAAYWAMEQSDKMTATIVWAAKFAEAEKKLGHEVAVREADATVRRYFPSNDQSSKPAILRDRLGLGYFTFLYGFGSKLYQMDRRIITKMLDAFHDGDAGALDKTQAVARAVGVLGLQMVMVQVAGEYLSGRGKKNDESWGEYAIDSVKSYAAYQIPVAAFSGGGRGAMPVPSLIGKAHGAVRTGLEDLMKGNLNLEMVGALGSAFALRGAGMNQATKTGRYLDQGLSRDLRRGEYTRVPSRMVFGVKAEETPIDNPLTRYLTGSEK